MISSLWNAVMLQGSAVLAQAAPEPEGASAATAMTTMQAATGHEPNFQPYVFLAYGLACLLLLMFSVWTFLETKQLQRKTEYLKERFLRAHPDTLDSSDG